MNIAKEMNGDELNIKIEGRLDTTTAPELEEVFKASLDGAASLILDFTDLVYVSSAGLRVILTGHKSMSSKGGMKIVNVSEVVKEVFDVTGFSDILDIE